MNNNQQGSSRGVKLGKGFKQPGSNQAGNQNYQQPAGQQNYQTNQYAQSGNYNAQQFQNNGNNYSNNQGNMYQGTPSNTAQPLQETNKKKPGKGFMITGVIIMAFFILGLANNIYTGNYNDKTDLIYQIIVCAFLCAIGGVFILIGYLKSKKAKNNGNM